jgi:hypothetical protein
VLHVGGGLPVLRAPGRTVDLHRHPAGGGARDRALLLLGLVGGYRVSELASLARRR